MNQECFPFPDSGLHFATWFQRDSSHVRTSFKMHPLELSQALSPCSSAFHDASHPPCHLFSLWPLMAPAPQGPVQVPGFMKRMFHVQEDLTLRGCQSLSPVLLFATPWAAACQGAVLSFTVSQSLLKLTSIESVMPSNHLMLCRPLLLLPSVFPKISLFQ